MITSRDNKKIKDVMLLMRKASFRREKGLFVIEGIKEFREVPEDRVEEVFVSESFWNKADYVVQNLIKRTRYEIVSNQVYYKMTDTKTPQGIMALVKMEHVKLEDVLKDNGLYVILEKIQDPGNMGTILRSGEAAGISCVIADRDTVDIYNPKVARSTMGAIFRVPVIISDDLKKTVSELKNANIKVYAAHLDGADNYDKEDYKSGTGFLIGNESQGLSNELAKQADKYIKIPMLGKVESLNAAIATSVLLFEAARQRR